MKAKSILQCILSGFIGCIFAMALFCWTYTYDTDTPLGSDAPSVIDDRIREVKDAVQERMNIDHYWPLTGSQVSEADAGKHRWIQFREPLSNPASVNEDEAILYTADISSKAELCWIDEDENIIQITTGGKIEYQSLTDVNSNTYIVSVNNAGTGTANLIKADANDLATLPDGAVLEAATASGDGDRTIADKGYIDNSQKNQCRMYLGSNQENLSNGVVTIVELDTDDYDPDDISDTSSYKITPNKSGYYLVIGQASFGGNLAVDKAYRVHIYKNTEGIVTGSSHSSNNDVAVISQVSTVVHLNGSTDYIQLKATSHSGNDLVDIQSGTGLTFLVLSRLGG